MALHKPSMLVLLFAFPGPLLLILWEWEHLRKVQPNRASWLMGVGMGLPLIVALLFGALPHPYLAPRAFFQFPSGGLSTEETLSRPSWALLEQFNQRFLKPDQSIFCYQYCSFYSFALHKVNATPYDNFDIERYDPAMVRDLLARLAAEPPDWVLLDGRYGPNDPVVDWIKKYYKPLAMCRGLFIVERLGQVEQPSAHSKSP